MKEGDDGWMNFQEIKEKADARVVLSKFVSISDFEQRGAELVGCCPFGEHGKKESFSFNVENKKFQCFSCKRKGSVLDFVMQMVAFREKRSCDLREAGQMLMDMRATAAQENEVVKVERSAVRVPSVDEGAGLLVFENLGVVARAITQGDDAADWVAVRVSSMRQLVQALAVMVQAMEAKAAESHAPPKTARKSRKAA